jgi:septal ring factor EnvC (AmiA/AmiB activator)
MHQKLNISLRWLVSGEGAPRETAPPEAKDSRVAQLESDIARKSEKLARVEKERDALMLELLGVQREHMKLLKERIEEKKNLEMAGRLETPPIAYSNDLP